MRVNWQKSSYSNESGGNCVEVGTTWTKSSHSGGTGGNCVEVAATPRAVLLRDSRHPTLGHLTIPAAEWRALLAAVRREELSSEEP